MVLCMTIRKTSAWKNKGVWILIEKLSEADDPEALV